MHRSLFVAPTAPLFAVLLGSLLLTTACPPAPSGDDDDDTGEGEGEGGEGEGEGGEGEGEGGEGEGEGGEGEGEGGEGEGEGPAEITLLAISDWHGQLDSFTVKNPPLAGATCAVDAECAEGEVCASGGCNATVGGAGLLSTYFADERLAHPGALTVTAGDAFGGTPPLSSEADLPDEPSIKAMRLMGFDVDGLGNHNFDRGVDHLQQLVDLATAPTSGANPGTPLTYVSSNLTNLAAEVSGIESPFVIKNVDGVQVAFVGITNDDAGALVFPGRLSSIVIEPSAAAAMTAQTAARAAGADVVVALVHMGAVGFADPPANTQPIGPIVDFAEAVSGFDVIVADHTDVKFQAVINGQLVVENKSKGATFARISISWDGAAVTATSATFVQPKRTPTIQADPALEDLLAPYRADLSAVFDEDVGDVTGVFPRDSALERSSEAAIGNLVTDALRSETGSDIAFVNGGGLRAAIPSSYAPVVGGLRRPPAVGTHDVLVGDIYAVLPFGNTTATFEITPATLYAAMEHGLGALPGINGKFPQISGFTVVFDAALPVGSRVLSITLDGDASPLSRTDTTTQITAATSDFVVLGGDGYVMLRDLPYVLGDIMAEDLLDFVRDIETAGDELVPVVEGRLTANVVVPPSPLQLSSGVAVESVTMTAGNSGVFAVSLTSPAPAGGTVVTLSGTDLTLPATVTIAAGARSTTFRAYADVGAVGPLSISATSALGNDTLAITLSAPSFPGAGDLVINEMMFDVPSGVSGSDYNCDGLSNEEDDEFVEIVNASNRTIDLTGVGLWDTVALAGTSGPLFTFEALAIGPGESVIVLASFLGFDTTEPWCALADVVALVGDAVAVFPPGATDRVLNLNNSGGDSVTLTANDSPSSTALATASYGATAPANVSQTRAPDITGAFAAYSEATGAVGTEAASPGLRVDQAPFAAFDPAR